MMRRLTSSSFRGRLAARGLLAGTLLLASGLIGAGAQTTAPSTQTAPTSGQPTTGAPTTAPPAPVVPPITLPTAPIAPTTTSTSTFPSLSAPAQSPPCQPTTTQPNSSGQLSPLGSSSTNPSFAPTASSQAAPLIGANPATPTAASLLQYQNAGVRPSPFGSELFCGANLSSSTIGVVDPGYIMKPGDQISITLWGSVPDANITAVIDTNGNVVVPGVGPVKVGGLPAGRVDSTIKRAAAAVYRNAVHIYSAPVTTVPITVFITGPVTAPGPYAGLGSDSVLAFLQRAGGIDPNRGSYRNITVRRGGQAVAHIDLYPFLRTGEITSVSLHNGDVIVVGQQGPVVSVSGIARAPFTFEMAGPTGTGQEVLYYARPRPEVNYAAVLGFRNAQPLNVYDSVADFARLTLMDGDRVGFSADAISDTVVVQVTGAFHGPASYVVSKETSLGAVLARIPLDPLADRRWIHLQRVSAAFSQKQLLSESLARLQKAVYTQPAPTAALVSANAAQATTIQQYITYANQITPVGDVAFPPGADLNRVSLEPDDIIVIPYQSQVVSIGGEVTEPQALIYQPGATLKTYIKKAGGFGNIADKKHILVIHPDGSTTLNGQVGPGDRVLVLVHLPGRFLDLLATVTGIIYQAAIGAKAAGL